MQTQVESCGFRIDLVVRQYKSGLKLAIECDGPTHFENGDGQVYVLDDYERQGVLESAGWNFYRLSYFDFVEDKEKSLSNLLDFVQYYFANNGAFKNGNAASKEVERMKSTEVLPEAKCLPKYRTVIRGSGEVGLSTPKDSLFAEHKIGASAKAATIGVVDNRVVEAVDQSDFDRYLVEHCGGTIRIKYWSVKKASPDTKYRTLNLVRFDDRHFFCRGDGDAYSKTYLRDRVVGYR